MILKQKPPVVRVLDAGTYSKIAGELRKQLPGKVIIDIDRGMDERGRSIVMLRCRYPEIAKRVIAEVLGEEYVAPEISEDLPEERREHWQRGMDSIMGGRSRDTRDLKEGAASYARKFHADMLRRTRKYQADIAEIRERLYKKKGFTKEKE